MSSVIQKFEDIKNLNEFEFDEAARDAFVEICCDNYGAEDVHNLLQDIYHFQSVHQHQYEQIKNEIGLKSCRLDIEECSSITRHYRTEDNVEPSYHETKCQDSNKGTDHKDKKYNLYLNVMDNVHVLLFHLQELGLRIDDHALFTDNEEVDDEYGHEIDALFIQPSHRVLQNRTFYKRIDRFSSTNKYSISHQFNTLSSSTYKEHQQLQNSVIATWIDQLLNKIIFDGLHEIIVENEYDTDSLCQDTLDITQSNIYNQISDVQTFNVIEQFIASSQSMLLLLHSANK